ncbi:hypothetical protein PsYK624_125400 [Phanerochaete sordida]|uniref:Uncharacterized protein n=1 Tax=Phanerochaete sordida TaxID=48140 RepID=A0A9P3GKB1_9APHY|nr:hypothetical protein PsYK624_125400 [Phanerochaete sordida]
MRSFRHLRQVHQLQDDGTSLTVVLLRDGTTYFGALLVIDILQLVTFTAATSISMPTYVAPFLDTLPALLTQRFMLNLRQLHGTRDTADTAPVSRLTLSFRAPTDLLGNAGEDLDYGSYDERGSDGTLERGGYQGSGERPLSTLGEEPKSASADGLEGGCSNGDGVPGSGAVLAI